MRIGTVALLAILVGGLSGIGVAKTEFLGVVEYFEPVSRQPTAAQIKRRDGRGPKVLVVGGTEFNFDTMAHGAYGQHAFVVQNVGDERLTLRYTSESCGMCIMIDEEYREIAVNPGESAEVVVKYAARKSGETFHESAYFQTNDAIVNSLRFDIMGVVTQAAKLIPADLALGGVSASEEVKATIKLLGYRSDRCELIGYTFSDPAVADYFQIAAESLSKDDVVAADKHAASGLAINLTIKPGLPLGMLNQVITFQARSDNDHNLELRVNGEVVGDIVLMGVNYKSDLESLDLGIVERGNGRNSTLFVLVKGPYRNDVKLSIGEVDPPLLKVTLGEGMPVGDGRAIKHSLSVELPDDAPPMNRLGNAQGKAGLLVIETSHPTVTRLPIKIRFAVQ
jgi:hypothetical protein